MVASGVSGLERGDYRYVDCVSLIYTYQESLGCPEVDRKHRVLELATLVVALKVLRL